MSDDDYGYNLPKDVPTVSKIEANSKNTDRGF
jgi:hypothetical protein